MTFKKMLLVVSSALVPLLAACGAADEPTSIIDPATGELVAINYPTNATFVDVPEQSGSVQGAAIEVCPVTDPSCVPIDRCTIDDPRYPYCDCNPDFEICEPPPPPPPPPCVPGLITSYTTARVGREPNATLEVNSVAGTSCDRMVVTGIGATIVPDSKYESLHVQYRQPYADGTMGPPIIVRTGTNTYKTPEAWAAAPEGFAIVGVAAGQQGTHDLRTLTIYYRRVELTAAGVRMTGPIVPLSQGANPNGTINASYIATADNNVLVGVGFASAVEQTKTIAAHVGTLP